MRTTTFLGIAGLLFAIAISSGLPLPRGAQNAQAQDWDRLDDDTKPRQKVYAPNNAPETPLQETS